MAVKTDYKRFTRTYSVYNNVYMSLIINTAAIGLFERSGLYCSSRTHTNGTRDVI